jgi:hypothetical protein
MKHVILALPVALLAAGAFAQTENSTQDQVLDPLLNEGQTEGSDTSGSGDNADAPGTGEVLNELIDGSDAGDGTGATASDSESDAGTFGTNWPLSVGTTFFQEGDSSMLRDQPEITSGWQSLSTEDRDMILADCDTFLAAHGSNSAAATGTATAESPATGDASATSGTDAATTAPTGYTLAQMIAICETVDQF